MQQHLSKVRSRGFTIIELLIVIVVIGILAAITIVAYNGVQNSARDNAVLSDAEGVATEVTHYQVNHNGLFSSDGSGGSVTWYSGNGANSNISFTPTSGDIIDVVANNTDYCIRAYNPHAATYTTLLSAATKSSSPTACSALSPSTAAYVAAGINPYAHITWVKQTAAGQRAWNAVTMSSDGTKLAAADKGGYIYTSNDSGATWTQQTSSGSRNWLTLVSSSDGTKLVALTSDSSSYAYMSTDSGVTWNPITAIGTASYWFAAAMSSDGSKIVIGPAFGSLRITSNSGATWSTVSPSGGSENWRSLAMSSDGSKILGVAYQNPVAVSTNSGSTWSATTIGTVQWGLAEISGDGSKWAIAPTGNQGPLYVSSDGTNWSSNTTPGICFTGGISMSNDGSKIVIGVSCGGGSGFPLYTSTNGATSWSSTTVSPATVSNSWNGVATSSDGKKIVAVQGYTFGPDYIYTGIYGP